jgi:aspartokinase
MVTVSNVVKKIVNERPMIYEALAHNIVNYANLAEQLKPKIEAEMGAAKDATIMMALRRHSEKIKDRAIVKSKKEFHFNTEIIMKTGLIDITFVRSPSLLAKLGKLYDLVDFERGDTLNIIQGNYEVTIVISERYENQLKKVLGTEKVLNREQDLVSLAMTFSKDFLYTPGVIGKVTRLLAWESINIFENISTMTELTFIVSSKDAIRAYNTLKGLVDN